MAKLSRNARGKARSKRTLSQTRRTLRTVQAEWLKTHMMLLGVLAQCGGEKDVTVGTLQQVRPTMGWTVVPKATAEGEPTKEFTVRLLVAEEPSEGEGEADPLVDTDSAVPVETVAIS